MAQRSIVALSVLSIMATAGCSGATSESGPPNSAGGGRALVALADIPTAPTDIVPPMQDYTPPSACAGLSSQDLARSPMNDPAQIVSVQPYRAQVVAGKISWMTLRGATATVLATPGVTKQWLTRLAACDVERHPLAQGRVGVSVEATAVGFEISFVTVDELDRDSAKQILDSAKALISNRRHAAL